jgi:hypothetical protein
MPIKPVYGFYTAGLLRRHPEALFVFGDNLERRGTGGQACIRHEPNVIGIATKKAPRRDDAAYFTDEDMPAFREEIARAHELIAKALKEGRSVYWPADGIGTGLSAMPDKSPALYDYLCRYSRGLFERAGLRPLASAIVCGGRDFIDTKTGEAGLDGIFAGLDETVFLEVIEGGARGADTIGGNWADKHNHRRTTMKADWDKYKKAAGFIRNSDMARCLAARRDQLGAETCVISMPGGKGTAMMCKISAEAGFRIETIGADPEFVPQERPKYKSPTAPRREKSGDQKDKQLNFDI